MMGQQQSKTGLSQAEKSHWDSFQRNLLAKRSQKWFSKWMPRFTAAKAAGDIDTVEAMKFALLIAATDQEYPGSFKRAYERTRNPMRVWIAYQSYRMTGDDVPEWVLEYFDRVIDNLLANKPGGAEVALEMRKPGKSGRGNVFKNYEEQAKWLRISRDVDRLIKQGKQKKNAVGIVAHNECVSTSTVRRACTMLKKSPTF
jgi:hypothetical protein